MLAWQHNHLSTTCILTYNQVISCRRHQSACVAKLTSSASCGWWWLWRLYFSNAYSSTWPVSGPNQSFFINPSFGSPFKSLLFLLLLLLFSLSSMLSLWLLLLLFSTDFFSTFIVCFFTSLHIPVWYYFSFSLNNVIILILLLPLSPLLIY